MELSWRPHKGPQEAFHKAVAFEVLYGGAAGGGKTESLVIEALRYVHVPGYSAILFRRTFPELSQARGLLSRTLQYYPLLGGSYNKQEHVWRFPGGSTITLSHMENVADKYQHQSAEYAYIGFDELTTFEEEQYLYLFSRARSTAMDPTTGLKVPVRIRNASNPGNVGHEWVKARFGPWLESDYADKHEPLKGAEPMEVRWFIRLDDVDTPAERGTRHALSRTFIPATLYDNPTLMELDPEYESRLMVLSLVERERLLKGNWDILIFGNVFKPEWFSKRVYRLPEGLKWKRYWDLAASTKTRADFTAGLAGAVDEQANFYFANMLHMKKEWPDATKIIKQTTLDEDYVSEVGIEKKAHGLAAFQEFMRDVDLIGHRIIAVDVDTDKLSRALIWSARAEHGQVILVEGPWITGFLAEAAAFDGSGKTHDDRVDAASGVVQMLAKKQWLSIPFLHL